MPGRTIRVHLVDGTPTGVWTAEIINWSAKVIVAPRSQLADLAKRTEVARTGVYCLVGPDPDHPSRDKVYVGEGDSVLARLVIHDKDDAKEFWTRTVVVISKDENLTKSHGRYLESRLITLIQATRRATLANGTSPPAPPLPEADIADMEGFLEQVQLIFPVLGLSFLQAPPAEQANVPGSQSSPRFVMNDVGTHATAIESSGEFVVLKGSTARKQGVESWTAYCKLRDDLVEQGKLADSSEPGFFSFTDDVSFDSPSAAASVVAARNTNGRRHWRVESTGQTYADWHEQKVTEASGL